MLAGLVGLALPVIIHLIARSKFPVQYVSNIRLLRSEKRENVFAAKLVDPLQLLLRLLVIALLVLAMARLLLPAAHTPAARNLVVVIDASASMQMPADVSDQLSGQAPMVLDKAKTLAWELLSGISLPSRSALVTAGSETKVISFLGPSSEGALAALKGKGPVPIDADGGTGPGLVSAVAQCCEMLRGRREVRSQIVVLTDLRAGAFQARSQADLRLIAEAQASMGEALEIIVVGLGSGKANNLAVVDAYLRGDAARIGDDAHVIARVQNLGEGEQTATLSLTVTGKQEPPFQSLVLQPGEEAVVDLANRPNRSVRSFATVLVQEKDSFQQDNLFSVPFAVSSPRRVLIVNGVSSAEETISLKSSGLAAFSEKAEKPAGRELGGAQILQYALNPARELGLAYGTGIDTEVITPDALPAQALSRYDVIVLYDVSGLPSAVLDDLDTFVRDGKALLFVCSATLNPFDFNSSFGIENGKERCLAPVQIGTDRSFDPAISIRSGDPTDSPGGSVTSLPGQWLSAFRGRKSGALSIVHVVTARDIRAVEGGASVLLRGSGGEIMAVEAERGRGRVVLFAFGFELARGNIAVTKVFPELMWRLIDYLTGKLQSKTRDSLVADQPAALGAFESAFSLVDALELTPATDDPRPTPSRVSAPVAPGDQAAGADQPRGGEPALTPLELPITRDRAVLVKGLPLGHYRLHKRQKEAGFVQGYFRPVAVNPDFRESEMTCMGEEELRHVLGAAGRVAKPEELASIAPHGQEVWRWVVLAVTAAYLLEALSAYLIGLRRARRLEANIQGGSQGSP